MGAGAGGRQVNGGTPQFEPFSDSLPMGCSACASVGAVHNPTAEGRKPRGGEFSSSPKTPAGVAFRAVAAEDATAAPHFVGRDHNTEPPPDEVSPRCMHPTAGLPFARRGDALEPSQTRLTAGPSEPISAQGASTHDAYPAVRLDVVSLRSAAEGTPSPPSLSGAAAPEVPPVVEEAQRAAFLAEPSHSSNAYTDAGSTRVAGALVGDTEANTGIGDYSANSTPRRERGTRSFSTDKAFAALGAQDVGLNAEAAFITLEEAVEADVMAMDQDVEEFMPVAQRQVTPSLPSEISGLQAARLQDWPSVEVACATRIMLLTWARWGRNALRIRTEERLKVLQHVRHRPRRSHGAPMPAPSPGAPLSPQPTPRQDTTQCDDAVGGGVLAGGSALVGSVVASAEKLHMARPTTVTSHLLGKGALGEVDKPQLLFDVMLQDQRESMDAQGVKVTLSRKFNIEPLRTESAGTPGFGKDTPNFPGGKTSRVSPLDSAMSSGTVSPMAPGQLSPWILEAEALLNGEDDCNMAGKELAPMAWGLPSAVLGEIPEAKLPPLSEEFAPIMDEDELEKISMFVSADLPGSIVDDCTTVISLAGREGEVAGGAGGGAAAAVPDPQAVCCDPLDALLRDGDGISTDASLTPASPETPSSTTAALASAPEMPRGGTEGRYIVGETVKYWSTTRGVWLSARIVEQKSRNLYLIDKQMRGCLAKIRASELLSAAEERHDPVLRAFALLDDASEEGGSGDSAQHSRNGRLCTSRPASTRAPSRKEDQCSFGRIPSSSGAQAHAAGKSPRSRGRIVRDDFSDDSDDGLD